METGPNEAHEPSTSTAPYHRRSPSIPTTSSLSGTSSSSHRQGKRPLSNTAPVVLVHATAPNGYTDPGSGGGPPSAGEASIRTPSSSPLPLPPSPSSSFSVPPPSPSTCLLAPSTGAAMDAHHLTQTMDSIGDDEQPRSGSGKTSLLPSATSSSSSRRGSGGDPGSSSSPSSSSSTSSSSSYEVAKGNVHANGHLRHHLEHHGHHDDEQGTISNYHTSPPLRKHEQNLPLLADYRSIANVSTTSNSLTEHEHGGSSLFPQEAADTGLATQFETSSTDSPFQRSSFTNQAEVRPLNTSHIAVTMTTTDASSVKHSDADSISPNGGASNLHKRPLAPLPLQQSTSHQTSAPSPGLPSLRSPGSATWSNWSFSLPWAAVKAPNLLHVVAKKRISGIGQSRASITADPHRSPRRVNWETVIIDRELSGSPTPRAWRTGAHDPDQLTTGPSLRHEDRDRKRRIGGNPSTRRGSSTDTAHPSRGLFHLQPVPTCKRRRFHDHRSQDEEEQQLSPRQEEHETDATKICTPDSAASTSHQPQSSQRAPSVSGLSGLAGVQKGMIASAEACVQSTDDSGETADSSFRHASHTAMTPKATLLESAIPNRERTGLAPRDNLFQIAGAKGTALSQLRCTPLSTTPNEARNLGASISGSPPRGRQLLPAVTTQPHTQSSRKRPIPIVPGQLMRMLPRPRRTQSVPNMRARPHTGDLAQPAVHRLMLPAHFAQFLASLQRTGRPEGDDKHGVPWRALPFALGLGLTTSSSSREAEQALLGPREPAHRETTHTPPLHPPITRHTLRELDLTEILKNPQLRHDVVFDANVQFRPNFDGERGKRKKEACERYWIAVTREIELGCTCTTFEGQHPLPCSCSGGAPLSTSQLFATQMARDSRSGPGGCSDPPSSRIGPSRLPNLVQELRAICLSILPGGSNGAQTPTVVRSPATAAPVMGTSSMARTNDGSSVSPDHTLLTSILDPSLISQQLAHGVLDVGGLVTSLASVLQLHCAPMRDDTIDQMVKETRRGNIGKGLRMCFEILELMKLDVANHQLRSARPYLVETAVEFEARWFRDQIEANRLTLDRTTSWFCSSLRRVSNDNAATLGKHTRTGLISRAFNHGFMRLIFEPPSIDCNGRPLVSTIAGQGGPSLSSSSLNHTYSVAYPETFQFDAFRLMSFHNDAIDVVVIYMLLMLFRQLSCSPAIATDVSFASTTAPPTAHISSIAATVASKQIDSVKSEVWCLVAEANATISRGGVNHDGDIPASLAGASGGGRAKLTDPRWRRAMKDAVLQVAARAGAVWEEAAGAVQFRPATTNAATTTDVSIPVTTETSASASTRPPSAKTIGMLESWLENNLSPQSALMKLCQQRLHSVLASLIDQKIRGGSSLTPSASAVSRANTPLTDRRSPPRKRGAEYADHIALKRHKGDGTATCDKVAVEHAAKVASKDVSGTNESHVMPQELPSVSSDLQPTADNDTTASTSVVGNSTSLSIGDQEWETSLVKAGLEPLRSEIRVLGARMFQVAGINLKTFRVLYERLAAAA